MPTKRGATATGESWRDNYRTPTDFIARAESMWNVSRYCMETARTVVGKYTFDPFYPNHSLYDNWDGFLSPWQSFAWINPPFSRYKEAVAHGLQQPTEQLWICGVDNSTKWFQALWDASAGICLLNKRVHFVDPRTNEPTKGTDIDKGNAIFYRGTSPGKFAQAFMDLGRIITKTEGKPHVLGL